MYVCMQTWMHAYIHTYSYAAWDKTKWCSCLFSVSAGRPGMETLLGVWEVCETMYVASSIEDTRWRSYLRCHCSLIFVLDGIFSPLSLETLPVLQPLCPPGPPVWPRPSTGGLLQLRQSGTQAASVPAQRRTQGRQVSAHHASCWRRILVVWVLLFFSSLAGFVGIILPVFPFSRRPSNGKKGGVSVPQKFVSKTKAKRKSGAARRAKKMAAQSAWGSCSCNVLCNKK